MIVIFDLLTLINIKIKNYGNYKISYSYENKNSCQKFNINKESTCKKDAAKDLSDLFEDSLKDIYWAEKL
jgi:hypothetical protein